MTESATTLRTIGRRRSFVVVGGRARASADFRLDDLPSTSGRLDVLARVLRAALLVSHGVRADVVAYLVLRGGPEAPRVVRITGAVAKFLRPDERSLAVLLQKALASRADADAPGTFAELRHGVAVARGDLELALDDAGGALFLLDAAGEDVRATPTVLDARALTFVLGDPWGLDAADRHVLTARGALPLSVGPVDVHSEDAVTLLLNELDRRP